MNVLQLLLSLLLVMHPSAADVAESSTVIVVGDVAEPGSQSSDMPYCSGVLISRSAAFDVVVTARHCTEQTIEDGDVFDPRPRFVQFANGQRAHVLSWSRAPYDDLAFLFVTQTTSPVVTISTDDVLQNVNYFAFGMPQGNQWASMPATALQGDTSSNSPDNGGIWKRAVIYTCPGCGPGDSGGGMYDAKGELVGITVAGEDNYALVVPANRVINALQYAILDEEMR